MWNKLDTDDDNDGVKDSSDDFPTDATESVDTDSDGIGDNADSDDDNDDLPDAEEVIYGTDPHLADSDGDSYSDGDEVSGGADPLDANDTPMMQLNWFFFTNPKNVPE